MTDRELEEQIKSAIKARTTWEERQRVWYDMRHGGLRRAHKPFPGAADLHFPLADTLTEKLKPFYFAQLTATDTFATLVCKRAGQDAGMTTSAVQWMDYKLRSQSNFQTEILIGIDRMLGSGAAPIKVYWNEDRNQVRFAAIPVTQFIVPSWTEDIQDADWIVHVQQMSEAQYRANKNFNQDKDFVASIKGTGSMTSGGGTTALKQDIDRREGLTYSTDKEMIVLWEIYQQDHSAKKDERWTIKTRSPLRFDKDVRKDFGLPYKHGRAPFVLFQAEVKEQGCYSSRGVTEVVAPFEVSACKVWNDKHDYMSFTCRPMFTADRDIPNVANIQYKPGQILPMGLSAVTFPKPPISFDEEMNQVREIAEYRIALPDFGVLQEKGGARTATEISQVAGQSSTVTDIRTRTFRLWLADLFTQAWALLVQYDGADLAYTVNDVSEQLQPEALHLDYEVLPNGNDQSWNRTAQLQRAMARLQAFTQNPFINQGELVKSVLELDDPRLVKRLFVDPNAQMADQMQEQAEEIGTMLLGFPCQTQPANDDLAHLQSIAGFVARRLQNGEPLTQEFAKLALNHGGQHAQQADQKKTPGAKQLEQQMQPIIDALRLLASGHPQPPVMLPQMLGQQPQGQPGLSVLPPPGAQAPGQMPGASGAQPPPTADKIMNALAALIKAGVPVTPAEINDAMAQAGLPPIQATGPIVAPPQPKPQEAVA